MSLNFFTAGRGKRRAMTLPEALAEIDRLNVENDLLTHQVVTALMDLDNVIAETSGWYSDLLDTRALAKRQAGKIVRAEAEHRRLRTAVIAGRPRIIPVPSAMVRPYAVGIPIPYPVPLRPRDTSGEITQETPLLDLPAMAGAR